MRSAPQDKGAAGDGLCKRSAHRAAFAESHVKAGGGWAPLGLHLPWAVQPWPTVLDTSAVPTRLGISMPEGCWAGTPSSGKLSLLLLWHP